MATIYLRHPRHGTKVAVAEAEALADEKNGWERYDVASILRPIVATTSLEKVIVTGADIDNNEIADLRRQWEAKHGKPPHHRKSAATLRAGI